ncbi:hypothetical protein KHQ81_11240 [Mycoplasmatota bacterium]|nr:hypothetical protein KHQ81_11240 [Mycoplasmatota bacterium]
MKYIAPAIFGFIGFIIIGGYFLLITFAFETILAKIIGGIIALAILISIIFVYIQRINEMKEEEKNDYSQY